MNAIAIRGPGPGRLARWVLARARCHESSAISSRLLSSACAFRFRVANTQDAGHTPLNPNRTSKYGLIALSAGLLSAAVGFGFANMNGNSTEGSGEQQHDGPKYSPETLEEAVAVKDDVNLAPQPAPSDLPDFVQYLIVGAGTAAFAAYRAIKAADARAKIMLISEDARVPYMLPPLTKELWFSQNSSDQPYEDKPDMKFKQWTGRLRSIYYEPEQFYTPVQDLNSRANGGIAILKGRKVVKIDVENQLAHLDDGRHVGYGKCLIATDSKPKTLPVFNDAGDKVTYFRTIDDFFKLNSSLRHAKSVVVVGGGFIGSELACSLASWGQPTGLRVTQIYAEQGNMSQVLPSYLSTWATSKVKSEGVTVLPETKVLSAAVKQDKLVLSLSNGQSLEADHAVVAVGLQPESHLARASGLEVDEKHGGFKVNAELAARTNLWVAGDAASFYDVMLGRRRSEHHDHAIVSGKLAGENMTGSRKAFTHQSMFWSDLGPEVGYEGIGLIDSSLQTVGVFTKDASDGQAAAGSSEQYKKGVVFYLQDRVVVGVLMWNVFNKISLARKILMEHRNFEDLAEAAKLFDLYAKPATEDDD